MVIVTPTWVVLYIRVPFRVHLCTYFGDLGRDPSLKNYPCRICGFLRFLGLGFVGLGFVGFSFFWILGLGFVGFGSDAVKPPEPN